MKIGLQIYSFTWPGGPERSGQRSLARSGRPTTVGFEVWRRPTLEPKGVERGRPCRSIGLGRERGQFQLWRSTPRSRGLREPLKGGRDRLPMGCNFRAEGPGELRMVDDPGRLALVLLFLDGTQGRAEQGGDSQ